MHTRAREMFNIFKTAANRLNDYAESVGNNWEDQADAPHVHDD